MIKLKIFLPTGYSNLASASLAFLSNVAHVFSGPTLASFYFTGLLKIIEITISYKRYL